MDMAVTMLCFVGSLVLLGRGYWFALISFDAIGILLGWQYIAPIFGLFAIWLIARRVLSPASPQ